MKDSEYVFKMSTQECAKDYDQFEEILNKSMLKYNAWMESLVDKYLLSDAHIIEESIELRSNQYLEYKVTIKVK